MRSNKKLLERYNSRIGLKIDYWTILEYKYSLNKRPIYLCQCICGKQKELKYLDKNNLQSKSCGCRSNENKRNNRRPSPEERLNKYSTIYNRYKREAKTRSYPFELNYIEFEALSKQNCYYCGIEPQNEQWYNDRLKIKYNGIDRVDNSLGYIITNCVPCCKICNESKRAVTKDIIEKAYNFLFKND